MKEHPKYSLRPVIIWICLVIAAIMSKFLHFALSSTLIIFSASGLLAYTVHGVINTRGKNAMFDILFALHLVWNLYFIYGILFNDGYPFNEKAYMLYIGIFAFYLLMYRVIYSIKKHMRPKNDSN